MQHAEYFSVVFSDFYLCDALLGLRGADLDARATRYLMELELDDKVQDPHYRQIFYRRRLPDLKARGKTVLVISHDDRYYHLASRIIRLEYGKVGVDKAGEEVSGSAG